MRRKNCRLVGKPVTCKALAHPRQKIAGRVIFKTNYACEQRKSSAVSGGIQSVISPRDI